MADDIRYGGNSGPGRNDDDRFGSTRSGGSYNDPDRNRGYGAYDQGGSYGQSGYRRDTSLRDDYRRDSYRRDDHDRQNERYGNYDADRPVAIDETPELIASNKVEGTAVYDRRGDRLGSVYNFMVNKRSGKVEYAVLAFGGFLGMGARHYPLPWNQLTYDERHGGYVVDITERDLDRAPSHRAGDDTRFDRRYSSAIDNYYGSRY